MVDESNILRRLMETLMQEKLSDEMFDSIIHDLVNDKIDSGTDAVIFDSMGLSIMKNGVVLAHLVKI